MFTIVLDVSKKGQSTGTAAAVLVLLIATITVVYILFLPPETRQALLNDEELPNLGGGSINQGTSGPTLLSQTIGEVKPPNEGLVQHSIPAFNLYTKINAMKLKEIDTLYIKDSWFDKKDRIFSFSIPNGTNIERVLLGFRVLESSGRLLIKINGEEIYNNEITTRNIEPISIEKSLLKQNNNIEFAVSDVGIRFWGSNKYSLSDLIISADVKDETNQVSRQRIIITKDEKENILGVKLSFYPDCSRNDASNLDIILNNVLVYSAVPECGIPQEIAIDKSTVIAGENQLVFMSKEGVFTIDQAILETELEGTANPIFYFTISPQLMLDIENGFIEPIAYMQFQSGSDSKQGILLINGRPTNFDSQQGTYRNNIAHLVQPGSNTVEIIPRTKMYIPKLEIRLERVE